MAFTTPIPETVAWTFLKPITVDAATYAVIEMRAPTGEDMMKALAIQGQSQIDFLHRIIEVVSGVPYDVVKRAPMYMIQQIEDYLGEFANMPVPSPLAEWRRERDLALAKEVAALAKITADGSQPSV